MTRQNHRVLYLFVGLLSLVIAGGCIFGQAGTLPPPDPTKPLYQRATVLKHQVAWPMPKTAEELDALAREIEIRARAEETAKFRGTCRWFNLGWLLLIPAGLFLGVYLKQWLFFLGAGTGLVMVPLTFTLSIYVPVAAPWIALATVVGVVITAAVGGLWLARRQKQVQGELAVESTALRETIDFTQSLKQAVVTKIEDLPKDFIKGLAHEKQSPETQLRVKKLKLIGG